MAQGKTSTKSVALIIGSVRPGRNGPKMAKFVIETIRKSLPENIELNIVDIADFKLPAFEGAEIPIMVKSSDQYSTEMERKWSREIASHDGYIFMVPEYNGSFAGSLKNSFDYLLNEWLGKSAMLVNYGGRPVDMLNGGKHFADILSQFKMNLPSVLPKISISTMDREKTAAGEDLVFYEKGVEEQVQSDILTAWEGVLGSLRAVEVSPVSA